MNIQNLQAGRTQLLYELGEVEYEKRLLLNRLDELTSDYNSKITALQSIESEIDDLANNIKNENSIEKNDE